MTVFYIDIRRILDESSAGVAAAASLKQEFLVAKKKHDVLALKLESLEKKKGASPKKPDELRNKIRVHEVETQRSLEESRQKPQADLFKSIRPQVAELAKKKNASSILDLALALYVDPKYDLTDELLKRMK
ncbi:MAG: hypothetical protein GY822_32435 [Deltaproteobacteria bacterium]|nr:hypothetical protein [Deltaproteobacteria bacterium]